MKCNYCDYSVSEECKCCPNCGEDPKTTKKNLIKEKLEKEGKTSTKTTINTDRLYILWGVLGYFIPPVGIILFLVWNKTRSKDAKAAGIGALIRIVSYIFFYGFYAFIRYLSSKY